MSQSSATTGGDATASPNSVNMSADASEVRDFSRRLVTIQAWIGVALLLCLPLFNLMHPTKFPWQATLHALAGLGFVVLGGYAGHHALYVIRGSRDRIPVLRTLTYWSAAVALLTAISGNWAYMPYRGEGGARQRLLDSAPFYHSVLMEFKEFIGLLPLPMFVAASFIFWKYRDQLLRDTRLASTTGVLVIAAWALIMAAAVCGISIAKVQFL